MSNIKNLIEGFQKKTIDIDNLMTSIINNYVLVVNGDQYEFCEIEVYYYKKETHEDCGVLKRTKQAGDIFFHRYGMDICFKSNGTDEYGGILIRSLKKDNEYFLGSWDCSYTLLNKYHSKICISIEKKELERTQEVCKTTRIRNSCEDKKLYRFLTVEACNYMRKNTKYWQKIKEKTQNCCKENND